MNPKEIPLMNLSSSDINTDNKKNSQKSINEQQNSNNAKEILVIPASNQMHMHVQMSQSMKMKRQKTIPVETDKNPKNTLFNYNDIIKTEESRNPDEEILDTDVGLKEEFEYENSRRYQPISNNFYKRFNPKSQWKKHAVELLELVLNVLFFSHVFACIWIKIAQEEIRNGDISWAGTGVTTLGYTEYIFALYFITVTMTTVGYGDLTPKTKYEQVSCIFLMLAACGNFAYMLNRIGKVLGDINKISEKKNETLNQVNKYMVQKQISRRLRYACEEYIEYYFENSLDDELQTEANMLGILSEPLKNSLLLETYHVALKDSPIFKRNFSQSTIMQMVNIVSQIDYAPEQIIYQKGDILDDGIYFIDKGGAELVVTNDMQSDREAYKQSKIAKKLIEGQSFGDIEFFTGQRRLFSYRSKGFTRLLRVSRREFLKLLQQENQDDYEHFCHIRDMLIQNMYSKIYNKCFSCSNQYHTIQTCPYINYKPNVFKIYNKCSEYEPVTDRQEVQRSSRTNKFGHINTLSHLVYLQESLDCYIFENEEMIENYEFYGDIHYDDDSDVTSLDSSSVSITSASSFQDLNNYDERDMHQSANKVSSFIAAQQDWQNSANSISEKPKIFCTPSREDLLAASYNNSNKNLISDFPYTGNSNEKQKLKNPFYRSSLSLNTQVPPVRSSIRRSTKKHTTKIQNPLARQGTVQFSQDVMHLAPPQMKPQQSHQFKLKKCKSYQVYQDEHDSNLAKTLDPSLFDCNNVNIRTRNRSSRKTSIPEDENQIQKTLSLEDLKEFIQHSFNCTHKRQNFVMQQINQIISHFPILRLQNEDYMIKLKQYIKDSIDIPKNMIASSFSSQKKNSIQNQQEKNKNILENRNEFLMMQIKNWENTEDDRLCEFENYFPRFNYTLVIKKYNKIIQQNKIQKIQLKQYSLGMESINNQGGINCNATSIRDNRKISILQKQNLSRKQTKYSTKDYQKNYQK